MDVTGTFRRLVQQAASAAAAAAEAAGSREKRTARPDILPPRRPDFARPAGNVFLCEAYIIARHLREVRQRILGIRPAYLNLPAGGAGRRGARLSDPERDEIDRGIKAAVCQVLDRIQALGELGAAQLDAMPADEGAAELLRRLVGALDPRRAGAPSEPQPPPRLSRRDAAAALQSSVVWWLNARLRQTNQIHAEMQEEYLRQKLERQRGLLPAKRPAAAAPAAVAAGDDSGPRAAQDELLQSLSPQQLQQLRTENDSMLAEFESTLDQIRDTQRSIAEIATLQTRLAGELDAQMQQTEQLYNEAVGAVDSVGSGNAHLVEAYKTKASARKWVLFIFLALSVVLLFLDWFD
ncbi:hypothetical protein IWQ57_005798 [Coemansia nantahalensis]|uniref:Uncharacterized protein n=1 Tax=Coemansia nantahalensis TaxID=2789366 RepID=A0ACC1JLN2_9FUNG|nr:hypothetical protein IWQ57_005798 [Coemansia nantahalensis]